MPKVMHKPIHSWLNLFWVGTFLMGLYYVADSSMDALLFDEGTVFEQIFFPDTHELAIRILSGFFFFSFFLYARYLFINNQQLQQTLWKKSQELIAANLVSEAFTHSFSSEMRSSLANICAAEQTLSNRHSHEFSMESQVLIRNIHESSDKMSSQITAALDLSQAIRSKLVCQQVSLNRLVNDVAQDIISGVNDITVSIETERNINAVCDPDLMRLAIKNLCFCAINHCKPNKQAEISIGVETRNGKQTFFVRHNGLAFVLDEDFDSFELPDHLSTSIETSETSTGLPVVKTIIQRHGGRIWSERVNGGGASFCFTL